MGSSEKRDPEGWLARGWRWLGRGRRSDGQGLAEMAVALPLLLLIVLGVFEIGRLMQSWVTIQHAVEEAARLASTGVGYGTDREARIAATARDASRGLQIIDGAGEGSPGSFRVVIRSSRSGPDPLEDPNAGGANDFVRVEVYYNHPIVARVLGDSVTYVPIHNEALVVNEHFARPTGVVGELPPTPVATWTPTPLPTPTHTPVPSPTPTGGPYPPP